MTMKSVTVKLSSRDLKYLNKLVEEDYAVSKSEALRRMIREQC